MLQHSLNQIERFNANRTDNYTALHGLTMFSDLTPKEFEATYLTKRLAKQITERQFNSNEIDESHSTSHEIHRRAAGDIPKRVDWREKGVVTKVKNQKQCGACWAFCVTENLETMSAMKTNITEEFSVQELIDCAGGGNEGCDGGDMCTLLGWMNSSKIGVVREKEYPLKLVNDKCRAKKNQTGVQVVNFSCQK